jgi:CRISPR-associated protein Cmr1
MTRRSIDLTLELLSPAFIGGAFPEEPEFRIASLRGAWRYWYRALYGTGQEDGGLVEGEGRLFGSVFGEDARRSAVRLVPRQSTRALTARPWQRTPTPTGADYLLFTMDMNRRSYLEPGQTVQLDLTTGGDDEFERAGRSLAVTCAFGGIGARSRRMAGAVSLLATSPGSTLPTGHAPNPEALAARLADLIGPAHRRRLPGPPRYHVIASTAFRAGVLRRSFADWRAALDAVGTFLREFRLRRQPDYDVAKHLVEGRQPHPGATITRAAFGLPLTFRFRSAQGRSLQVKLGSSDRRGSPLFLSLERLEDGGLAVVWSHFRAPLSPDGSVQAGTSRLTAPGHEAVDEMLRRSEWASHAIAE